MGQKDNDKNISKKNSGVDVKIYTYSGAGLGC